MSATGYGSLLGNPRLTRKLMDKMNGDASALLLVEFFGAPASGGVTGTLAQTLAGGAVATAGKLAVRGAEATSSSATVAAQGRLAIRGASALASSASAASVGALAIRGSASASIGAVAAAVGALAVHGQAAPTIEAGVAATGTVLSGVVGALAVTLDNAGVVFVGVVFTPIEPISGAASRRLNRATVSGAGVTTPGASILTGRVAIRAASAGVPRRHY